MPGQTNLPRADLPKVVPGPPKPSSIPRPGLWTLPPGVERYRVAGGGAVVVGIEAGGRIALTDLEGRQMRIPR